MALTEERETQRSSVAAVLRDVGGRLLSWRAALLAALLVVVVSVPRFSPPTYALESNYTDHMQHEYDAWAFLHIGIQIFYVPMRDWIGVDAPHAHLLWDSLPAIYPPGLVLFFVPFGVASNTGLVSDLHVHLLMVITLGVAAVLASFQLLRTLRLSYEPTLAAVLTFFGTILFVHWGLDGFIDPLAAGLALLGIYWMRQDLPGRALLALAAGLSLQYRMLYLWPLVIALAIRHRREVRPWQLACAAVIGLATAFTFILSVAYEANFRENPAIGPNALSVRHGVSSQQAVALAAGLAVIGIVYLFDRRAEVAACVALALSLIFFVDQWEPWYPVVLVPLLTVVRTRPAQVAVTLVFLEVLIYLGGLPNLVQTVHLYIDSVR